MKAYINYKILKWVMEDSGLDSNTLSKKIGVTVDKVNDWIQGKKLPTLKQLYKIANITKRPPAIFYLKKIPEQPTPIPDFRGGSETALFHSGLKYYIRRCQNLRDNIIEISELLNDDEKIDYPTAFINENPENIAQKIRESFLRVIPAQKFNDIPSFFRYCRELLESKNILIFLTERIDLSVFRGLSIIEFPYPVFLINGQDSYAGKLFTLFHEFGHLLLRTSGICNFEDDNLSADERKIEVWCNHFAGAFLCPKKEFLEITQRVINTNLHITIEQIEEIANYFKVSSEVIARRLLFFQYIDNVKYRQLRRTFQKQWEIRRSKAGSGFANYERKIINQVGLNYSLKIIEALNSKTITPFEASEYLSIKPKHLNKIINEITERVSKSAI